MNEGGPARTGLDSQVAVGSSRSFLRDNVNKDADLEGKSHHSEPIVLFIHQQQRGDREAKAGV